MISEEALLRMIAAELGCSMGSETSRVGSLALKDLIPGLNDISVVGRVIAVFPTRAFDGKRSGKVAGLLLGDRTGLLRLALWNDQTSLVEQGKIKSGQIVRFTHVYTRSEFSGGIELHTTDRSEVEVDFIDVELEDFPELRSFMKRLQDLSSSDVNRRVNIEGTVRRRSPPSDFERSDSTVGRVMRFLIIEGICKISVVVWNENVDRLEKHLEEGATVRIINGKLRRTQEGGFELHVDGQTSVEWIEPLESFVMIGDLFEGLSGINIKGEIVYQPLVREVHTSSGDAVKLVTVELKDDSGKVLVAAWRGHADILAALKKNDQIALFDIYVKKGFTQGLEVSTRDTTTIKALHSEN